VSEETILGVRLSTKGKGIITIVIVVIALCIAVISSVAYEAHSRKPDAAVRPPPTYTGSAPLTITNVNEAKESNNNFILVFTPCNDELLNTSVLSIAVTAADRIRAVDGIYVGVFELPQSSSLAYPMVMVYYPAKSMQYTFWSELTEDAIYNQYLNYKFMH